MNKYLLATLLVLVAPLVYCQQSQVRVFQYNLLNYGNSANPTSFKNPRLRTIVQAVSPDIVGVNEVRNDSTLLNRLRDSVLGPGWVRGRYINTNNETQVNSLFWKDNRFVLLTQTSICQNLRDIIAYRLYYRDSIPTPHDSIILTVIVAHLKASRGSQDSLDRAAETQQVVNYLNNQTRTGNYIFMGDLNLYTSSELAYQNLIANPVGARRLYDPIERPGDWAGNFQFSDIHTQSTRTTTTGDGGVTGGLDDRFDHIMISGPIKYNSLGVGYVSGSYKTLGQDGQHLNKSLLDPPSNSTVSSQVLQALYDMSDHLPVYCSLTMTPGFTPTGITSLSHRDLFTVSSTYNNGIPIAYNGDYPIIVTAKLVSMTGRELESSPTLYLSKNETPLLFSGLDIPPGLYLLILSDKEGYTSVHRLVRSQ